MSHIRESAKDEYSDSSVDPIETTASTLPIHFLEELYKLLFRNPKAEFTIYGISLLTVFTYAIINHFVLGRPQKVVLYEGAMMAVLLVTVSILVYIYRNTFLLTLEPIYRVRELFRAESLNLVFVHVVIVLLFELIRLLFSLAF